MDLRQLNTFIAAAAAGSFAQAALDLHYAPSTVTEQIRALERSVGAPLFERQGRGVELTEPGRRLLPFAEQMVGVADEARAAFATADGVRGSVVIGGLETLCAFRLPRALAELRRRHPDLEIRVEPASRPALERALLEGVIDLALTLGEPFGATQIAHSRLHREPLVFVVPPDHSLAARESAATEELYRETFVTTAVGCSFRALIDQAFASHRRRPAIALEFGSVAGLKHCVAERMGVTLLPEVAVAQELAAGTLVAVPWEPVAEPPSALLSWHQARGPRAAEHVARTHLQTALAA